MEYLFEKFRKKLVHIPSGFERYLMEKIDWSNRLIGIKGARGTGKTTMLLQYAKKNLPLNHKTIYVSLDDIYFTENRLTDFAGTFVKEGGEYLLADEVHRYKNWSQEIKNLYDDHPELKIIFTGSSVIHLQQTRGDLSRRALMHELHGLSFREFLNFTLKRQESVLALRDILSKHDEIATELIKEIKPLEHFRKYLKYGYYPYFAENTDAYPQKLLETVFLILESDIPSYFSISTGSIDKIKRLLYIISESVPFSPNISKISERIEVTRNTLVTFLYYLEEARIIKKLYRDTKGIAHLQKPEKIYLHHSNLHYSLSVENHNTGAIRESFFANQVGATHDIAYSETGDFNVNNKYIFEVGGKDKGISQIKNASGSYIAADGIETGFKNKIPLWVFGFLY